MSLLNPVSQVCAASTASLLVNYRPSRITRKSYRPRASDRTMVDTLQPRCLSCFRIRKRRHENRMNPDKTKTPKPSQQGMGWKAQRTLPLLPVAGEIFLLTFPSYRTAFGASQLGAQDCGRYFARLEERSEFRRRTSETTSSLSVWGEPFQIHLW